MNKKESVANNKIAVSGPAVLNAIIARRVFFWVFVVAIAAASLHTVFGDDNAHVIRILAVVELASVALFVPRQTRRVGFVALLIVFAVAGIHHLAEAEIPYQLAIYAAGAWVLASDNESPLLKR